MPRRIKKNAIFGKPYRSSTLFLQKIFQKLYELRIMDILEKVRKLFINANGLSRLVEEKRRKFYYTYQIPERRSERNQSAIKIVHLSTIIYTWQIKVPPTKTSLKEH
jgi:hypothetical protein